MRFETPAGTILFLYQNHQDTSSKIQDLYESISMPYSQPPHGKINIFVHLENVSMIVMKSYVGSVHLREMLLDMPATLPVDTQVLTGRVAGMSSKSNIL
jgi:hypothetical protein